MITVITITVFIHIYANILEQCSEKQSEADIISRKLGYSLKRPCGKI